MDSDASKMKRSKMDAPRGSDNTLNARKAIRFASKGRGGIALAQAGNVTKGNKKGMR
jgi:regulator of ribosome biosynthesis